MARIETKTARKEYKCGRCGETIQVGSTYYSWTPFRSSKRVRCDQHYPRPSEVTSNEKLAVIYAAQESVSDAIDTAREDGNIADLVNALRTAAEEVRGAGEMYQESYDNLSGYFQGGEQLEAAEQGVSDCEDYASSLESAADDIESGEGNFEFDEDKDLTEDEQLEMHISELIDIADGVDCPL